MYLPVFPGRYNVRHFDDFSSLSGSWHRCALDDAAALEYIGDAAEENLYIIPECHMGGVLTVVAGFDVNRQLVASVDLR